MSNASSTDIEVPSGMDLSGSRGPYLFWVCVAVIVLSTLAVALRFVSRKLAGLPLLFDDWTILIALPCVLMPSILDIYCTKEVGFGKHVLALGPSSDNKIREFWFHLWISNILYSISMALIKISILLFLHRIFQSHRVMIYASVIGVLVGLWGIATILTTIFSCHPIQGFWDQSAPHTCINIFDYALGTNIPNIVFDIIVIALPLAWLWRLRVSLSQKIALGFVFALAGFVVAVGALRLQYLVEYGPSSDFTWDFVPIGILTALETNSALICACLPPMSPLLRFCIHGTFSPCPCNPVKARWPGQKHDLSKEEAADLARIAMGDAFKNHGRGLSRSLSSKKARKYSTTDIKPVKNKEVTVNDLTMDMESGLEPPRRIKRGWATPKESRFSDW